METIILAKESAVPARSGVSSECKICAIYLNRRCYARRWQFRLVREPLVWGMRLLAWANGLEEWKRLGRQPECQGCVRFLKAELEGRSPTFRWLNRWVGPRFKVLRDSMLEAEEHAEAKRIAKLAGNKS